MRSTGGVDIGPDLVSCSNVTNDATSYCCDHTGRCCDSGVGRFTVLPAIPTTTATWDRLLTRFVAIATPSSSATSQSTSTTSQSTTTTSQSTTTTSSSSGETSPSSTTSSTSVAPNAPSQSPLATSTTLSTGAQAGIGIGAGVGAILIAALIYVLWKLRKTEKALSRNRLNETEYASNNLGSQPVKYGPYVGPPQELDARDNIYIPELGTK
ncbi:hypothetical protein DL771_004084 [Monosporascus sp. 5C6A]|nr:hypothetical protein DL771_004084 [Monosporascus sp. 5C6A]